MRVDALEERVSDVKKRVKKYPASESALVSRIFKSVKMKRNTYQLLTSLDKSDRLKKFLNYFTKYKYCSFEKLVSILEKEINSLILIELLVVIHLICVAGGERRFDFDKYLRPGSRFEISLPEPDVSDSDFFNDILESAYQNRTRLTNVEFAETLKVVAGPYKGRLFSFERAPYQRQIHEWMSPENNCRELTNMWGVQIGKSTVLENTAVFYMKCVPSEIMAVVATEDAAKKLSKKRIEPRAHAAGVKFIAEKYGDTKKRDTGNATLSKEFFGGNFDAVTAGSPSKLASETKRILLKDEVDRWPQVVGKEGDPDVVVDVRADAWADRAKILNVSSPNEWRSRMHKKYEAGTKHHYHVKCPHCGDLYPLRMGVGETDGLTYETKAGRLDESMIYYICPKCKNEWFHYDKLWSMQNGLWVQHKEPDFPNTISTQLSTLYSPMKPWKFVCKAHIDQVNDPDKEPEFVNMILGLPYEPRGSRPDSNKLIELRSDYKAKEIPEGVLFITASVDVQRGSSDPKKKNPPRLEVEIMGTCDSFMTKSIEYVKILGDTSTVGEGAWKKLAEMMDSGYFAYERKRDNHVFEPYAWGIDARDGERTEIVYSFCRLRGGEKARVFPIMGFNYIQRSDDDQEGIEDRAATSDYVRYRKKTVDSELKVLQISTNHYKKSIYQLIKRTIEKCDDNKDFAGKCFFPSDYPDSYFKGLTAEDQRADGSFYCPPGRRNEPLDLKVYNHALSDMWMNLFIDSLRDQMKRYLREKKQTHRLDEVNSIDYMYARDILIKRTRQIVKEEEGKND